MKTVIEQTEVLVESIQESDEYSEYKRLLKTVMQDENLYEKVNEFRRRNFVVQVEKSSDVLEEIDKLQKEYADLLNNLLIKEFLAAEQIMCKMMRQINNRVLESLEMDISFLE